MPSTTYLNGFYALFFLLGSVSFVWGCPMHCVVHRRLETTGPPMQAEYNNLFLFFLFLFSQVSVHGHDVSLFEMQKGPGS